MPRKPYHTIVVGRSAEKRPIRAYTLDRSDGPTVLVFGGFHGDEPKSVSMANRLVEWLSSADPCDAGTVWVVVPLVNPDGYARRRRRNANGVDLNRNFPTSNWKAGNRRSRMYGGSTPAGEPETRAVMRVVERFNPSRIVTIHSINQQRQCNNYDGPGRRWASKMSRHNGYPVTETIGYPTPGSFGTWAGTEGGMAVITLELPSHHSTARCWRDNRSAILCCGGDLRSADCSPRSRFARRKK